jgi:hypothetical protein
MVVGKVIVASLVVVIAGNVLLNLAGLLWLG